MNGRIESIWEEFRQPLTSFIRRRIAREHDAEDILQDVFLRICNGIEGLSHVDKTRAWVYRIARNAIADYYRKQGAVLRHKELTDDYADPAIVDSSSMREVAFCLTALVDSLPAKYRNAIALTELQDLKQREFSVTEGLSLSGAKSRVQRARILLRKSFLSCCSLEFDRNGAIADYSQIRAGCQYC